jgi:hypothetical protein
MKHEYIHTLFTGGEGGIRTPDTLRYTAFRKRHNRPL